jgi:hypothetical protein
VNRQLPSRLNTFNAKHRLKRGRRIEGFSSATIPISSIELGKPAFAGSAIANKANQGHAAYAGAGPQMFDRWNATAMLHNASPGVVSGPSQANDADINDESQAVAEAFNTDEYAH